MAPLTFFTIPKAFKGHVGLIQENAIRSWASLGDEVLLIGNEPGIAEAALRKGARQLPLVERNAFGTPLVSAAFALAQAEARYEHLCYLNADILLLGDASIFENLLSEMPGALLTGRRWDLEVREELEWDSETQGVLRKRLAEEGILRTPGAMDYFAFRKGTLGELPPFAVGRPGWDNWMLFHARNCGLPVIDASALITAIHQNHDYSHLAEGEAEFRNGPESRRNLELAGGYPHLFNLLDATHRVEIDGRITPSRRPFHPWVLYRWLMGMAWRWTWLKPCVRSLKRLYKLVVPVPK